MGSLRAPALFSKVHLSVVTALGAVALLLAGAPEARAASCSENLTDGLGFRWDVTSGALGSGWGGAPAGGFINDGGLSSQPPGPFGSEAYDGWGTLKIDVVSTPAAAEYYLPSDLNSCDREEGGREVTLPTKTIDGLEVSRKVYVPSSGAGLVRFLDFVRNPSPTTPVADVLVSYEGDLGSDSETRVRDTSSGDSVVAAPTDRWATSDADPAVNDPITGAPHTDPPVAHVWGGPGTPATPTTGVFGGTAGSTAWANFQARVRVVYQSVTIPANTTYVFMHFEAQRTTAASALTAAQALGNVTVSDGFTGMSETELSGLRNWNPNDLDGDGLSPSSEAALGTSATNSDTDADGRSDGADACPLTNGAGADGCPPPPAAAAPAPTSPPAPPAARDTTAPKLTLLLPRRVKRRTLVKGLTVIVRANEACSLKVELLGKSRSTRRRVRKFSLPLSSQALPTSGAGTRALRLRPSRRLFRRAARTPVQVRVTAVDRAGNRTVETRSIRVRR